MDSASALATLQQGLDRECADDIVGVLCNLADGTCDYVDLIPLLEQIAAKDSFYYFDDNGAGGFPHRSGKPSSFADWARLAIKNIRENATLGGTSQMARSLKSLDTSLIHATLTQLVQSKCGDEALIPVLEKIARKDKYSSYSYWGGYGSPRHFGESARKAIQHIRSSIEGAEA